MNLNGWQSGVLNDLRSWSHSFVFFPLQYGASGSNFWPLSLKSEKDPRITYRIPAQVGSPIAQRAHTCPPPADSPLTAPALRPPVNPPCSGFSFFALSLSLRLAHAGDVRRVG